MNIEQIREKFKGAYVSKYEKAKKNQFGEYMSDRNDEDVVLVNQELNIITVEDYCKWYGLYYLMEDPDTKEIMLVTFCHGDILEGIDHEYYPDALIKFCIKNNLKIDGASYLCICKSLLLYNKEILDDHLPTIKELTDAYFKFSKKSISKEFMVCMYDNPYSYRR